MTQNQIQEELIQKGLDFFKTEKQGYFNVAMRVGKCRIAIEILKKLPEPPPVVLLAYPDNKIKDVWIEEEVKWGVTQSIIFYCNFSSLHKWKDCAPEFIIIDEFHAASDNERDLCHQIMTNSPDTKTLALSGTVSKETKEEWGLKEIASYSTDEGIQDGILADYKITVHLISLDNVIKTPNKKGKLLTEKQKYDNLSFVIDRKREQGESTMFLALARNRLSLSSIEKMNYLRQLLTKLSDKRMVVFTGLAKVADDIGIPSYHSKSTSNINFLNFQAEKINQLSLAAMGKVGVTYPNLDSVILVNFTYNAEESSQILNRAIKLDYKGKIADLHILCLREKPEMKKIKESLSMLDPKKIKYV